MSKIAIKVENISKRYRIGLKEEIHDTFFSALASWVTYPVSNFRRIQKLRKFSGDGESEDIFWALRDISFEVERGEVLGIIGPNGAGKSTLLKILTRITEATSGYAMLNGKVASLLEVGTGFHKEMTGRENVYLNGTILGMKKREIDRKFDEIVAFSGVEKFIDTPVKRYSSGMNVRLAFSVAAHLDPEILLIDEVLAVGDIDFQRKCIGKMSEISKGGRTILFVSHNMGAIQSLCSRAILISNGRLRLDDDANIVVSKYITHGFSQTSEKIWPDDKMPGDNVAKLKSIRIKDKLNNNCFSFTVRDEINLETEFIIYNDLNYLDVSYYLYNQRGELVFATFSDLFTQKTQVKTAGHYKVACTIPGDFLNDGLFFLQVALTGKKIRHAYLRDIISFVVAENNDPNGARGYYHDARWPAAVVRPKFDWTSEKY